jgi:hypothetical protein
MKIENQRWVEPDEPNEIIREDCTTVEAEPGLFGKSTEDRRNGEIERVSSPKNEEKDENGPNFCEWIKERNNNYAPTSPLIVKKKLPPGVYDIHLDGNRGIYIFNKQKLELDELLDLPNPIFNQIINDIEYFWDNEDKFIKYKYAYKRGLLLYGSPGQGKTCITARLSKIIIDDKKGVVFSIKSGRDLENYLDAVTKFFRIIEPNTPILTIIEDLDGLLAYSENETKLLNILDGFYQSRNIVYIGCTNYPENLKERILNRPNRFDKRYYIGPPERNVRKFYLENKIKKEDLAKINLEEVVDKTENLSLAHLGELIKSVFIFGKDLDTSIEELKDMSKFITSSKYDKKQSGFLKKD